MTGSLSKRTNLGRAKSSRQAAQIKRAAKLRSALCGKLCYSSARDGFRPRASLAEKTQVWMVTASMVPFGLSSLSLAIDIVESVPETRYRKAVGGPRRARADDRHGSPITLTMTNPLDKPLLFLKSGQSSVEQNCLAHRRVSVTMAGARGGVVVAAAAVIAIALACVALSASLGHSIILVQDDVNHDQATEAVYSRTGKGSRGRLSASSSVADFFKAAMDGDFDHKSNVRLATAGLLNGHESQGVRLATTSSGASSSSSSSRKRLAGRAADLKMGRQQELAENNLRLKAAHAALARQSHEERASAIGGSGIQSRVNLRRRPISRNYERRWKYPTEDKFVARYTGHMPADVVPVDSFTSGPYVPI